jgi:hypothetical protein
MDSAMPVRAPRLPFSLSLGRWAAAALLSCSVQAAPSRAEDGFHPLDSTLEFMNLKTKPGAMPDFVQQTRPDPTAQSYIGVGAKPADHALKVKSPAEVKALTAELDAARAAQVAGKRPLPPGALKKAKDAKGKTADAKAKPPAATSR